MMLLQIGAQPGRTTDEHCSTVQSLAAIRIPGVPQEIDTKGLVVIVGPNSSGKTLLLRDIENKLTGTDAQFVVCQEMLLQKPTDITTFVNDLLKHKLVNQKEQNVKIAIPHFGRGTRDDANYQMDSLVRLPQALNNGWATGGKN